MTDFAGFASGAKIVWGLGDFDKPELCFNGTDMFGVDWLLEPVDGWKTTDVATPIVQSAGDGGWFGDGRLTPRVLTLRGAFRGPEALLDDAEFRLRSALEVYARDQTFWADEPVPKQLTVRQTGKLIVDEYAANPRIRTFSVILTAADPVKYSAGAAGELSFAVHLAQTTGGTSGLAFPAAFPADFGGGSAGGQLIVTNPGLRPVAPTVRIYGPVSSPSVNNRTLGQSEGIGATLTASDVLVFDHGARSVTLNGASIYAQRTAGSAFFPLNPGRSDLFFAAAGYQAAAVCVVTFRPAWS